MVVRKRASPFWASEILLALVQCPPSTSLLDASAVRAIPLSICAISTYPHIFFHIVHTDTYGHASPSPSMPTHLQLLFASYKPDLFLSAIDCHRPLTVQRPNAKTINNNARQEKKRKTLCLHLVNRSRALSSPLLDAFLIPFSVRLIHPKRSGTGKEGGFSAKPEPDSSTRVNLAPSHCPLSRVLLARKTPSLSLSLLSDAGAYRF